MVRRRVSLEDFIMKARLRKNLIGAIAALSALAVLVAGIVWWELRMPSPLQGLEQRDFVLPGVTVVNPGLNRRSAVEVAISEGIIQSIGDPAASAQYEVLTRYQGAFVLPGLIDMHSHLPPSTPLHLTDYFCFLNLAHGVTTILEAGDIDGTAVAAARQGIQAGSFAGPRLFACGPYVGGAPARWSNTLIIRQPGDARRAVQQIQQEGWDCVKSYDELSLEQIQELKQAARAAGIRLLGHVPAQLAYEQALLPEVTHLLGVPEVRHLGRDHVFNRLADWQEVDSERLEEIVQVTLQNGIVNTPTLVLSHRLLLFADPPSARRDPSVQLMPRFYRDVVWHPQDGIPLYRNLGPQELARLREAALKKIDLVGRLHRAGARLQIGTDAHQPFVVPGAALHQEMALFEEAGIPLDQIWAIATRQAGARLGLPGLGTVVAGAPADLLLFGQDPSQDLAALGTLQAVITQGRLYSRQQIDTAQMAYLEYFEGSLYDFLSVQISKRLMRQAIQRDY